MKKLLLPLVAAALGLSAAAEEATITQITSADQLVDGAEYLIVSNPVKFGKVQYGVFGMSTAKSSKKGFDTFEIDADVTTMASSYTIDLAKVTTVKLEKSGDGWNLKSGDLYINSSTVKEMQLSETATTFTITPSATDTKISYTGGTIQAMPANGSGGVKGSVTINTYATAQKAVSLFKVETGTGSEVAATRPVITCTDNTVTITAEEGAKIYYTTDETEPTDASTLYDAPFAITATTTVKAISYVEGKNPSPVASATCTFIDTYDGFAAVADLAANTNVIIEGPLTAVYQNGQNLYMVDSKGVAGLVYGSLTLKDIVNGDVFASLTGSISIYGGETQIKPVSLGVRSTGTPVEPIVLTAVPDKDMAFKYAKIEGATVAGSATASGALKNFTITLADGTELTGRNQFTIDFEDGTNCTLTGFVNFFSGNAQFYPVTIQVGAVVETVETPVFSVAAGEVASGTLVSITCETAGAKIYYTTDGTAPSEDSAEYTEPIAVEEDMTIKAIAVAEGMSNSAVATVAYTVLPAGTSVVNFNFASTTAADAVNNLTTDALEPEANNTSDGKGNLDGKVFTNGVIAMSVSKGGNTTTSGCPSWWTVPDGVRMYAENTANFYTVENNYKITKIEFSQASSSTAWSSVTATPGTLTGKVWESGEDDPVTDVKVTFGKASRFNNVKVYYEDAPGVTTGIEGIVVDENAPVEYFNLQGVRVANPENGLYIRRQGNKATKVLVK